MVPDDYPNWRTVFRMLLELRAAQPLVVVLDEFQYLGETQAALEAVTSELNAAWEQRRESRPLVLVLSGSSVRTLEALDAGSAPLHGRFSWKARLEAFDYCDASGMARFRSLRDRAYLYGIFGGTPRFMAAVDRGESLADNAARLMLDPRGEVRALVETALLKEQGLREVPRYTAILRAIGSGSTELNEIGQAAGLQGDTGLRQKVERLVGLGYVQPRRNLGARPKEPYRYRLGDPALMFYHAFVAPLGTTLERTPARRVWRDEVVPRMDTYMGHVFERRAEQAYRRGAERLPIVREWGFWEGLDSERKPLEMDVACQLTDGPGDDRRREVERAPAHSRVAPAPPEDAGPAGRVGGEVGARGPRALVAHPLGGRGRVQPRVRRRGARKPRRSDPVEPQGPVPARAEAGAGSLTGAGVAVGGY